MFILNNNDSAPLYKQLYTQIRERVLSGKLPAHARLPSVRNLAAELSTSRNTVEAAYQELYAEGYIYTRQRSGYFVSALDHDVASLIPAPESHRQNRSLQPLSHFTYDFHPARLDPDSFPRALWRTCFLECLREGSSKLSVYGDPQGNWGLRCNIRQYLEHSRGVVCEPDRIWICAGLQHSLDTVAHLLKEKHSSVAVEDPGYHLPRAVFRNNLFDVVPVAVGSNGLDLEMLRTSGSTIAYVTPSHQLPMGYVMPIANRLKLIEWAALGYNLIIEDDYDSELRYHVFGVKSPFDCFQRTNGDLTPSTRTDHAQGRTHLPHQSRTRLPVRHPLQSLHGHLHPGGTAAHRSPAQPFRGLPPPQAHGELRRRTGRV